MKFEKVDSLLGCSTTKFPSGYLHQGLYLCQDAFEDEIVDVKAWLDFRLFTNVSGIKSQNHIQQIWAQTYLILFVC